MKRTSVGLYARLSREDGDGIESDSIVNQQRLLEGFAAEHTAFDVYDVYIDDGYTGTNFDRPGFLRMIRDIEAGRISCVIVKDLSRFGRDYIEAGRYLEHWFPAHSVRFIAVTEGIDSANGPSDLMVAIKNIFNSQYAKDISLKVRSAIRTKQRRGEFVGAFASYGYQKDPADHNRLIIDPAAARIVRRVFDMYESGAGKIRIAAQLNAEGVPCPSEYKKLMGERYRNGRRLRETTYWTYSTVHRMLQNPMYAGDMAQSRDERKVMHGKTKKKERADWIVVEGTHEPIIARDQWERVQAMLRSGTRDMDFETNISPFAGVLRCGDCGRAMAKTCRGGRIHYTCGSYKRYGKGVCSPHAISLSCLEQLVLDDLNRMVAAGQDLAALSAQVRESAARPEPVKQEADKAQAALERVLRLKKGSYEDYKDGLLSRADFLRYRSDYDAQEQKLRETLSRWEKAAQETDPLDDPWIQALLQEGRLTALDRATVAETIAQIRIYEAGRIEIDYLFAESEWESADGG